MIGNRNAPSDADQSERDTDQSERDTDQSERDTNQSERDTNQSERDTDQSGRDTDQHERDANQSGRLHEQKTKRKANRWKTAFCLLAGGNVAVLVAIVALLLAPVGSPEPLLPEHTVPPAPSDARLLMSGGAEDLNTVINRLLAPRQHENLRYGIFFGDPLRIRGTVLVLGHEVELEARFHPEVLDNGDLLLVTDGMRIGLLPAPASKILSYVRTYYELPEWVAIEDGGGQVRLKLTDMPAGEGLQFRVLEMDAAANRYTFSWSAQ